MSHHLGNLFDGLPGAETNDSDDFMSKLEEVKVDYSALGEDFLSKVKTWAEEYKTTNKKIEEIKKAVDAFNAYIDSASFFGIKQNNSLPFYDRDHKIEAEKESAFEPKNKALAYVIKEYVEKKWGVKLSHGDIADLDLTSVEEICNFVAENINFGDTDSIIMDQKLNTFYRAWKPCWNSFELKGKKISINDGIWFNDWDRQQKKIGWEEMKKIRATYELLSAYHKERFNTDYSNINAIFSFYYQAERGSDFLYDKHGDDADIDLKRETLHFAKIFKNGKFELTFASADIAKEFFDGYVMRAMNSGE